MSRQSIELLCLPLKATGTVTAHRAIGFDGVRASVAAQKVLGIARLDGVAGDVIPVDVKGTAVVESGGVIAVGDELVVDNVGRLVAGAGALAVAAGGTAVTSTAANGAAILTGSRLPQHVVGHALQAAGAAGEFIEVLLR